MTRPGVSAAAFGALDMMEELRDRSADAQLPTASIRVLPEFNPAACWATRPSPTRH